MARKSVVLTKNTEQVLVKMGKQIKRARLRRNVKAEILAEQVGISKSTLSAIEKGTATVSIGAYAAVLFYLGLEKDLECVAMDEEGKSVYHELNFKKRKRATREK